MLKAVINRILKYKNIYTDTCTKKKEIYKINRDIYTHIH